MVKHLYTLLLIILSYLSGSTPTSIIAGKLLGSIDIREHGSGNAGATNVSRVLGWRPALFVVLVDILKGWFPCAILARYFFDVQSIPRFWRTSNILRMFCGFRAHIYCIWRI